MDAIDCGQCYIGDLLKTHTWDNLQGLDYCKHACRVMHEHTTHKMGVDPE